MKPMRLMLCTALLAPLAWASGAGDYARHWPVSASEPGAFAITLTPEIYGQLEQPDLGDLAAFNGAGEAMAFGPLPEVLEQSRSEWRDVRWFALPATIAGGGDNLSLQVQRDPSGAISLSADVGTAAVTDQQGDLLVDSGAALGDGLSVEALALEFASDAPAFNQRYRVDASNDLESWQPLVDSATLMRLEQGGAVLERRRIGLPTVRERYLRLRRLDGSGPLPVAGMRLEFRSVRGAPPPATARLAAEYIGRDGPAWLYRLPARIPVDSLDIRLASDNSVAGFSIASRDRSDGYWQPAGALTAFRLRGAGLELDNDSLDIGRRRDREWRLETSTELQTPPALEFSYQPETWLLLTSGAPPYRIAAGSARARRNDMPVEVLFAPIRAKYGSDWRPPVATLGSPEVVAGEAALQPHEPDRWRTWALWAVLVLGALGIVAMVLKLMREGGTPPAA